MFILSKKFVNRETDRIIFKFCFSYFMRPKRKLAYKIYSDDEGGEEEDRKKQKGLKNSPLAT